MITVTELAAEKLREAMEEEGRSGSPLRIVVMASPHGGVQYALSIEEEVKQEDSVIHSNGVRMVVDTDSLALLEGSEIDYVEGLMRSGFVINNPNIQGQEGGCACGGQCGCGGGGGGCGGH